MSVYPQTQQPMPNAPPPYEPYPNQGFMSPGQPFSQQQFQQYPQQPPYAGQGGYPPQTGFVPPGQPIPQQFQQYPQQPAPGYGQPQPYGGVPVQDQRYRKESGGGGCFESLCCCLAGLCRLIFERFYFQDLYNASFLMFAIWINIMCLLYRLLCLSSFDRPSLLFMFYIWGRLIVNLLPHL